MLDKQFKTFLQTSIKIYYIESLINIETFIKILPETRVPLTAKLHSWQLVSLTF